MPNSIAKPLKLLESLFIYKNIFSDFIVLFYSDIRPYYLVDSRLVLQQQEVGIELILVARFRMDFSISSRGLQLLIYSTSLIHIQWYRVKVILDPTEFPFVKERSLCKLRGANKAENLFALVSPMSPRPHYRPHSDPELYWIATLLVAAFFLFWGALPQIPSVLLKPQFDWLLSSAFMHQAHVYAINRFCAGVLNHEKLLPSILNK